MYSVVQFSPNEGGSVSVVLDKWLTPKKTQVFWPPTKDTKTFDKLLQQCSSPNERWSTYGIDRVFCETNELDKARKKLKLVEFTSDIQTEDETEMSKPSKRKIKKNNRYVSSDEDDDNENYLSRPPPLKKPLNSYLNSPRLGETNSGLQIPQSTNTTEIINTTTTVIENNSEPPGSPGLDCSSLTESLPICKNSKCGFQDKVVSLLAHIKAQNDIIMSILQEKGNIKPKELNREFKFPLETFEDLETAEQLLDEKEHRDNLVAYFKSLGGKGPNGKVSRVMKVALSDSMASKFNFFGKRSDKKAFAELSLRKSIVESLKSTETTEKDIEDSIKIWLKHAPERAKKRLSKQST